MGLGLIPSSIERGDSGAGVLVEIRNAGLQGQKFLRSLWFLKSHLTSLLFPGRAVGLFNQVVATRRGNDLDVLHAVEHRKRSNSRPVTPELADMNGVWDVIIHQQPFEKGLGCVRIPVRLQKDIQHRAGFIDGPLQPVFPTTDLDAHLV